jgi:phosphoenolpyruvate carboxykinase (ATP)
MPTYGIPGKVGLENQGLHNLGNIYWNLPTASLVEQVVARNEGSLSQNGAVVVATGQFTGRSPGDKFVVEQGTQQDQEIWWNRNQPFSPERFQAMYEKICAYLQKRDVFVQDSLAGADPHYRLPIRLITEKAWCALFGQELFIRLHPDQFQNHTPEFTIFHVPDFQADPAADATRSGTFILLDFSRGLILIGGTHYAGEIKKSIFTVMNYLMPHRGVLPMHCSANVGARGDVALFFGLSGTGKTTLSSDPERGLIGDDEHGWSPHGVFNFEGGCYAKTIRLRPDLEPLIWNASDHFGTVLENVVIDPLTRIPDFDDGSLTENTRAAYRMERIPNSVPQGFASHPRHIFFLTADAFGVMPPISRLTASQAMYYFLSGYTAKLEGTERGLGLEPQATFSTCFAAPFLPLNPTVYANFLGKKIEEHRVDVWLINTGWTGGPYGIGERIRLPYTRAMVRAVLNQQLNGVAMRQDPNFGLQVPAACPGVPPELLDPAKSWPDRAAYQDQVRALIERFNQNFAQFSGDVSPDVIAAGPRLLA